jgi:uncharacterized membrane protein
MNRMATTFSNRIPSRPARAIHPLILVPSLITLIFLALPWSVEHKAHLALHGLCAQRPSHTYTFDGRLLPFDARMEGIYSGFLVTTVVLFLSGAHRWCRPPSLSRLAVIAILGGVMAVDGFNSFLKDLALPYPYEPKNWLRLITGMTAGIVLGFALCFLVASSVWTVVDTRRQTLERLRLVPLISLLWTPVGLAIISGWSPLYAPLTLMFVFAAALALTMLSLVVLVILRRRDFTFANVGNLGGYGLAAIALAVVLMGLLAAGRTVLERSIGASPLT